jgi:hypothetical protein
VATRKENRMWGLDIRDASHNHALDPAAHRARLVEYIYNTPPPSFLDSAPERQQASPAPLSRMPIRVRNPVPPSGFTQARFQALGDYIDSLFESE